MPMPSAQAAAREGRRFSVRDWIEDDQRDGSVVFISALLDAEASARSSLTVWLDLAMNTLMAMDRTREVGVHR